MVAGNAPHVSRCRICDKNLDYWDVMSMDNEEICTICYVWAWGIKYGN